MTAKAHAQSEPQRLSRAARKRKAILDAATEVFLRVGYIGASMDEIADLSGASKQTVYKYFASKETLFVDVVTSMTDSAGDRVRDDTPELGEGDDVERYLVDYAHRQLSIVITPRIMQLRRLVIGEVPRFPDLAQVLYERGPQRAVATLADLFERLAERGLLAIDDPRAAASDFNWLIMSEPLSRAMLLGDAAIPAPDELRAHAERGVGVFLAAYGAR